MEITREFSTALKRVYCKIVNHTHSQLQFFVTAENLSDYVHKISAVPFPAYGRELLQTFAEDQKTIIDFKGFEYVIRNIFKRYLPYFTITEPGFTGSPKINIELINAALLVLSGTSSTDVHNYLQKEMAGDALECYLSPLDLEKAHAQFPVLCQQLVLFVQRIIPPLPDDSYLL